MYQRLIELKKEHDDSTKVPRNYENDQKLGKWVANQRQANTNKTLLHDCCAFLDSIDFDWGSGKRTWEITDWMETYQRLLTYKKQHNNPNVPSIFKEDPTQRDTYKNKIVLKDRVSLLDSIGFEWRQDDSAWMEMYEQLTTYKKEYNDIHIPHKTKLRS